jgi:signal transduction histidine kinase/predicted RNA-binding protein with RPS1 domain/DNA-binding response OmpR family regulator
LAQRYPKGTVLSAQVQILKPFGAVMTLDDGTVGIIRNRELSWKGELKHPGEVLTRGQLVRVLVLGVDRARPRLNLSLRQVEHNPWHNIDLRYCKGRIVGGRVVRLWRNGAFIELEPAVDGFLPLHEVSQQSPENIEKALWVGDSVEAVIIQIDHEERLVKLSLRQHLANLERERDMILQRGYLKMSEESGASLGEFLSSEQRLELLRIIKDQPHSVERQEELIAETWGISAAKLPRILLVDDDPSFRLSMQRLLARLGHEVEACDNAERALVLCGEKSFDLVLMDHRFRTGKLDGLDATRQLLEQYPWLPVIIVTGVGWLEQHKNLLEPARRAGAQSLLAKPVELSSLHRVITAIADGIDDWEAILASEPKDSRPDKVSDVTLANQDLQRALRWELIELHHATGAQACVLFHMEPLTSQVRVFAHAGAPLVAYGESKYALQASPIDEVIRLGRQIFEPDTSSNPQKFQHLKILDFSSCLGVPVKGFGQREYGLFLFHGDKDHFSDEHLKQAKSAAKLIAALITRKEAERVIQQVQPFVFAGQIGLHLVHELNNRLGSILNDTKTLALDCSKIEAEHQRHEAPNRIGEMQTCIRNLQDNGRAMRKIMGLYMGMVSAERREAINLNDVIQRVMSVLAPIAEGHGVKVMAELEKDLPMTLAIGVRLEQVFVNVALNAIQILHLTKGGGELMIQSRFAGESAQLPLQVRFTDTGPGIHGSHLENIFELGFSNRPEGTGLGLFITRNLVESMGGKISVEESFIMVRTTFLIEIPLIVPFVEGCS